MRRACPRCARLAQPGRRYCPEHDGIHTGWSPSRDRQAQRRLRTLLLQRADGRCEQCGETQDLRAAHITSLADGGTDSAENARLLCRDCDKTSDPYAR